MITQNSMITAFQKLQLAKAQVRQNMVTARVEMKDFESDEGRMVSIYSELDMIFPPMPKLIAERIALLRMLDYGKKIEGLGKRVNTTVMYIYFSEEDINAIRKPDGQPYFPKTIPTDPKADAMAFQDRNRTALNHKVE